LLRVFAGGVPDGSTDDQAREWTIASLQECAEVAAEEGVMLALENHGGITATVEQVEGLIAGADSDWVAVNLDTGNYRTDPYASITRTVPLAITAHVKTEVPGPNGKEDVDIDSVINALDAGGYRGYLSIEYEAAEDPMSAVPRFVETLQSLVR
jgi:sugar phosphate isomerase/epimerase